MNIEVIRQSFEKAKPIADQVADQFYKFLFADYPAAKPLFEDVSMEKQKKALIGSLVYIVDHLDDSEKLADYLRKMGKRHVEYGTLPDHYPLVGSTLLKTFAHFFGNDWTPELEQEWTEAYQAIASLMLEGAEQYEPGVEIIKKKANALATKLILQALEDSIDSEFLTKARNRIRKVLFELLEDESIKLTGAKGSNGATHKAA